MTTPVNIQELADKTIETLAGEESIRIKDEYEAIQKMTALEYLEHLSAEYEMDLSFIKLYLDQIDREFDDEVFKRSVVGIVRYIFRRTTPYLQRIQNITTETLKLSTVKECSYPMQYVAGRADASTWKDAEPLPIEEDLRYTEETTSKDHVLALIKTVMAELFKEFKAGCVNAITLYHPLLDYTFAVRPRQVMPVTRPEDMIVECLDNREKGTYKWGDETKYDYYGLSKTLSTMFGVENYQIFVPRVSESDVNVVVNTLSDNGADKSLKCYLTLNLAGTENRAVTTVINETTVVDVEDKRKLKRAVVEVMSKLADKVSGYILNDAVMTNNLLTPLAAKLSWYLGDEKLCSTTSRVIAGDRYLMSA